MIEESKLTAYIVGIVLIIMILGAAILAYMVVTNPAVVTHSQSSAQSTNATTNATKTAKTARVSPKPKATPTAQPTVKPTVAPTATPTATPTVTPTPQATLSVSVSGPSDTNYGLTWTATVYTNGAPTPCGQLTGSIVWYVNGVQSRGDDQTTWGGSQCTMTHTANGLAMSPFQHNNVITAVYKGVSGTAYYTDPEIFVPTPTPKPAANLEVFFFSDGGARSNALEPQVTGLQSTYGVSVEKYSGVNGFAVTQFPTIILLITL